MKLEKFNIEGKKESIEVLDKLFSAKINKQLVSNVIYKANSNYKGRKAKTKQKNAFVPSSFGEVGSGWKWLEMGTGTAALRPLFKGKVIVGWLHRGHFSGS